MSQIDWIKVEAEVKHLYSLPIYALVVAQLLVIEHFVPESSHFFHVQSLFH